MTAAAAAPSLPQVLPPLTRNGYVRSARTERLIFEALALDTATLIARARIADERDPGFLTPEALVFFMRRADQAGDRKLRSTLFSILAARCAVFFRGKIRGFTTETREDIQQEVLSRLVEQVFASDDRGDFAQAAFWTFLERKTLTEIDRVRQRDRRTVALDAPVDRGDDPPLTLDRQADPQLDAEGLTLLSDGLSRLDPKLRQVFLMRHALGMAIGKENRAEEDPADPSIAAHFNVSARSIGKWLTRAEAQLAPYRKA